jgi:polysaccharide export outer membrane protein
MAFGGGCASGDAASSKSAALAGAPTYEADLLREGDVISITCEPVTNLNTVAKIPLNGMLDLPFVGRVQVAGKTTEQLQNELLELYQPHVRAELFTVTLQASSAGVYVGGAVLRPGKIPMDRPMTVLEAIMESGGYDPNRAKLSHVKVLRVEDGEQKVYRIDLRKALKGEEQTPFYLKPFDTVQVPNRTINW